MWLNTYNLINFFKNRFALIGVFNFGVLGKHAIFNVKKMLGMKMT